MADVQINSSIAGARNSFYETCSVMISTWFWCGTSPYAPGTVGSVASLVLFPLIFYFFIGGVALLAALFVVGLLAVRYYIAHRPNISDPREVVIDEVCGQILTFAVPLALERHGLIQIFPGKSFSMLLIFLCSGVISFRLIDIIKPWPVCFVDKNVKGALGIMLDDLLAALPAAVLALAVMNFVLI